MMIQVRLRYTNKSSLILFRVSQSHYSLIAPYIIFQRRLITMKESIICSFLIFSGTIHKAKAIKRCFYVLCIPNFLENWFAKFSQIPLSFCMSNILNHTSMQYRRIVLVLSMSLRLLFYQFTLRENLHDIPKLINIFLTFLFWNIISDDNKAMSLKKLLPLLLLIKGDPIVGCTVLIYVHNN